MKFLFLPLMVLIVSALALSQQHYLISPSQEVIPLKKWQRVAHLIEARSHTAAAYSVSGAEGCSSQFTFGYTEDLYRVTNGFYLYHHDVLGQWYVAKATGTIDSIFWDAPAGGTVGAAVMDSTITVRIHNSVIGPLYGPGIRPGPFDPPCQNWGYWIDNTDLDQGVAAFPEDANPYPGAFHSTIAHGVAGPPFSNEIWGLGGFPVTMHYGTINSVAMLDLGEACSVSVGQVFFVSMKTKYPAPIHYYPDVQTDFAVSAFHVSTSDENYPSRNWKFYEHDSGPTNCAGVPVDKVKRGWVARGGFGADSSDVAAYNIWYTMTVVSNTPPTVRESSDGIAHNTLSTAAQTIQGDLTDCDPANPGLAGVDHAEIQWSVNGVPQSPVAMAQIIGSTWEGVIPGEPAGSTIDYSIKAYDLEGVSSFGAPHEYRIVSFKNTYYWIDTLSNCSSASIRTTGTPVDVSRFFNENGDINPKDDGQAGPFVVSAGGPMVFFADTMRYAWIGTNGAIALSKSPTDTLDITAGGAYSTSWTFPMAERHGRSDAAGAGGGLPPKNLIAPFYADFILGDTSGQYGTVVVGNGGDPCQYVIEYDSIGTFDQSTKAPFRDVTTFRVILNHCDGTIQFQYDLVGTKGQDSSALVGMQADSNSTTAGYAGATAPYVFLNRDAYPLQTKPAPNTCIKFWPGAALYAKAGWNLLSVSFYRPDSDYTASDIYSGAISRPFKYSGSYQQVTQVSPGHAYWLKTANPIYVGSCGYPIATLFDSITLGWNMIGTPSNPVPVNSIVPVNCMVSANFFGYNGAGYQLVSGAQDLRPGLGYWIKAVSVFGSNPGIELTGIPPLPKQAPSVTDLSQMDQIEVRSAAGASQMLYLGSESGLKVPLSAYEMPPSMEDLSGFDARFVSGRILETYPSQFTQSGRYEYPISIHTGNYPVTISMTRLKASVAIAKISVRTPEGQLLGTFDAASGIVRVPNPHVRTVVLTVNDPVNVPKVFALGQNYPNPFNPSTRIAVDIPKVTSVDVAVFNLLGQKIATLMSGEQAPGSITVEWDGRDENGLHVPSGVYFVRMQADGFTATQKVMVMK